MLVLNIWEGDDKVSLVTSDRAKYGHAAAVLEQHGDVIPRSLYMSWWPGHGDTELIELLGRTTGKTVNRDEDRTFMEDVWAENNHRYLTDLVFTAPKTSERHFWISAGEATPNEQVRALFRANDQTLPDHEPWDDKIVVHGTLERSPGHWIVDVPHEDRLYLCWNAKGGIKVQLNQGHRFLFEETVEGIGGELDALFGPVDPLNNELEEVPDSLRGPLEAHHFPVPEEAEIGRVSERQWFISSAKNDYYIVATDMARKKLRFYRWTRQHLAPDLNIRIPTLAADGRGLDDLAIARWWTAFNAEENPKWSTFDRNCSVIVATALRVGGAARFAAPHLTASWLCWTPSDIALYGEAVATVIGKKEKKRQKKIQRKQPQSGSSRQTGRISIGTNRPNWVTGSTPRPTTGTTTGRTPMIGTTKTPMPQLQPNTGQQTPPLEDTPAPEVWTKQQFKDQTKSSGLLSGRFAELSQIDSALNAYHRTYHGQTQGRINKLNAVLELIAKVTVRHPDSKKLAAVYELAEQIIAQRVLLIDAL